MNRPDLWEVFAIPFARIGERRVHENFIVRDVHDGPMPLEFYFWIARKGDRTVLIDTGFSARSAAKRSRTLDHDPTELLKKIDIDPATVQDIIITHLHYDHLGGIAGFTNARIHIQEREVAFATGRSMCQPYLRSAFEAEDIATLIHRLYDGRVVFHNGDEPMFEGMSLHLLPGHSKGLQGVRIATKRGNIVVASDAAHYYANILERRAYVLSVDLIETFATYDRLHQLVDRPDQIVPGHDPRVGQIYPRIAVNGVELIALHEQPAWPPPPIHRKTDPLANAGERKPGKNLLCRP
jgi:glyoxylase-like metal-dependent hydrolase (beta-lactamase superfamily II)